MAPKKQAASPEHESKRHYVRFGSDLDTQDLDPGKAMERDQHQRPPRRTNTIGSVKDRDFDAKLKRLETDIERDIQKKLNELYPGHQKY